MSTMKLVICISIPTVAVLGVLVIIFKRCTTHTDSWNCACSRSPCCESSCDCACGDKVANCLSTMCPFVARKCAKPCNRFCTWLNRTGNIFSVILLVAGLKAGSISDFANSRYHHELSGRHLVVLFLLILITVVFQTVLLLLLSDLIIEVTYDIPDQNGEEGQSADRADWTSQEKTRVTLIRYTVVDAILSLITQLWLHDWLHHPAFPPPLN